MKRKPSLACFLAVIVPGLGHIYVGKKWLGVGILLGVIIIGNLNAIWLLNFAVSQTVNCFFGLIPYQGCYIACLLFTESSSGFGRLLMHIAWQKGPRSPLTC